MDIWLGLLAFAVIMGAVLYLAFSTGFTPIDEEDEGDMFDKDR